MVVEKQQSRLCVRNGSTDFVFSCHFADENPADAVPVVTEALRHMGVFRGIKSDQ